MANSKHDQDPDYHPDRGGISRRAALAVGALGAGAAIGLPGCKRGWTDPADDETGLARHKPYVPGAEKYGTFEERWFHTSCGQCPAGCGVRIRVVEGRAVRIEGNPDNPINQGGIGPRGLSSLQALYDADRLTGPMARKNGELVPITWEEGIAQLAEALARVRQSAPHRLLVLSGLERGRMQELLARFCRAFGTPNLIDGRPSQSAAHAMAMEACTGTFEEPAFAWDRSNFVLSLEAGLLEDSCQAVYLARVAAELRRGSTSFRAKLVHAGAAFDLSAHVADEWLRIVPGTGGGLALSLCHIFLRDYDDELASLPADNLDAFRAFVADFAPARGAELTGLSVGAIEHLAAEMWRSRPAIAVVDHRSLSFSNGQSSAAAVLALNTLLAAGHTPGFELAVAPPLRPWPQIELDEIATRGLARPRLDRAGSADYPHARSVHETLPEAIDDAGDAGRPEVALLYYTNPVYARQQPARWRAALQRIPLVVSFSPYRDETVADVADLVLPDHTFLERWGDAAPGPGVARTVVGVRQPVIEPLHDTRSTGDVVIELAKRLGGPVAAAMPWKDHAQPFRAAVEQRMLGLRDAGDPATRGAPDREFLEQLYSRGFWAAEREAHPLPAPFRFQTEWQTPEWDGDAREFPLKLLAYRPLGYAVGSGANEPWLHTLRSRPDLPNWVLPVSIHPETAGPGIHDGDMVEVTSAWGSITLPARLDERITPDCVAIPMGGGHTAFGRWARGLGVNVMNILRPGPASPSGANVLCATRVRVTKRAAG